MLQRVRGNSNSLDVPGVNLHGIFPTHLVLINRKHPFSFAFSSHQYIRGITPFGQADSNSFDVVGIRKGATRDPSQ